MAKTKKAPKLTATLRDGTTKITVGDEVETNFHEKCAGVIFIISSIEQYQWCESGFILQAHVKGNPDRVLKTMEAAGIPVGLDANWFVLIKKS